MSEMKFVSTNARIAFRCQRCAHCCRHLKDSLMLEPRDIFYLSKFLRDQGENVESTEDMLEQFAHLATINGFPIYQMNVTGEADACVFLQGGACRVYDGRPQVCRMYPFGTAPGERGKDFNYYLCLDHEHHFESGLVRVKDWVSENFSREAKEFSRLESEMLPLIGNFIQRFGGELDPAVMFKLMYELYYHYDLNLPFLEQYRRNVENIKKLV